MEASWRLYAEHIDGLSPPVQRLAVHLKDAETVYFADAADMQQVLDRNRTTTLTAWFDYNKRFEDGRHLTYQQFPEHFTYDKTKKSWSKRVAKRFCVGRMYMSSPGASFSCFSM